MLYVYFLIIFIELNYKLVVIVRSTYGIDHAALVSVSDWN